ncbi:hypothetical protein Pint_04738 [Pistacia integerrima]|uniref:Uncharacterized protein n=1 Tax=Pistacia integerrima TaxID=434235 RepID=A0ACC0Z2J5_9ROSI|nr:hypothetical protein Pint_04738 [Pistacia integerrima]
MILPSIGRMAGTILIRCLCSGLVASKELDSKPILLSNLRTTKMNDDVLAIAVSPDAKYIAAALLDRIVKFELLLTLEGHHADVWCLAISNSGDYIVTGSHDRSIRHWDRTEEPISLSGVLKMQEEKEKRLEEMFESDLDNAIENTLDIAKKNWIVLLNMRKRKPGGNVAEFQPDIRMLGLSPSHYVLRTLSNVKTNDLEQTLLALPFADALKLLSYLKDWASNPDKVILFALWNI